MPLTADIRARWLARLLSTAPSDRRVAEDAVRDLYRNARFAAPSHFCWFDSPFDASVAVGLLLEAHHPIWRDAMRTARERRDQRHRIDRVAATLTASLGAKTLAAARTSIGPPAGVALQYMPVVSGQLQPAIQEARRRLRQGLTSLFVGADNHDELHRAEDHLRGGRGVLIDSPDAPVTAPLIGRSFFADYGFATMAEDEAAGGAASPLLAAAWSTAASCGTWWPFAHGAILADRPSALHVNAQSILHNENGPALEYPDGVTVYAWNGIPAAEQWILRPESVPRAAVKGVDGGLRKWIETKTRAAGVATSWKQAPRSIADADLPPGDRERLVALRKHAGGTLPLFDRYVAGEHVAVWSDLVALGSSVREEPHAADALAVAYETMRRVEANVRTVVQRLRAIRYRFATSSRAHVAPRPRDRAQRLLLDAGIGPLPLSLRAFYDVVGAVDFTGEHQEITQRDKRLSADPLVVSGVDDAVARIDEARRSGVLIVAPDDLRRSGSTGGDPYSIAVPDPRADGPLLDQRHDLMFVNYLRLCFRFGGFAGFEGRAEQPEAIGRLSAGLLPF